jgi:hypothetical protein
MNIDIDHGLAPALDWARKAGAANRCKSSAGAMELKTSACADDRHRNLIPTVGHRNRHKTCPPYFNATLQKLAGEPGRTASIICNQTGATETMSFSPSAEANGRP